MLNAIAFTLAVMLLLVLAIPAVLRKVALEFPDLMRTNRVLNHRYRIVNHSVEYYEVQWAYWYAPFTWHTAPKFGRHLGGMGWTPPPQLRMTCFAEAQMHLNTVRQMHQYRPVSRALPAMPAN